MFLVNPKLLLISIPDEYNEESCELLDIKETDKGYTLNLEIPSGFFGHIIGKNKETKKKIERETKTQIVFPKAHSDEDLIGRVFAFKTKIIFNLGLV